MNRINQSQNAPAKINLGIRIPFRYPDGYHHIVSLMAPIDLYDDIETAWIERPGQSKNKNDDKNDSTKENFSLSWENELPPGFDHGMASVFEENPQNNLLYKAYRFCIERYQTIRQTQNGSFGERSGIDFGLKLQVTKRIPSPAGLGGGSSDAAAIVSSFAGFLEKNGQTRMHAAFQKNLPADLLQLGADIPFFLQGAPAIISGVGEVREKTPFAKTMVGLLGIPPFGFSTPQMYQALGRPVFGEGNNRLSISKKALQSDRNIPFNLDLTQRAFHQLVDFLNGDCAVPPGGLLQAENENGAYIATNDFFEIAADLDREKWNILEKARKSAVEILQNLKRDEPSQPLISSMSGSGAAMYAGLFIERGQSGTEIKNSLSSITKEAKKKAPQFTWVAFSTL